MRQKKDKFWRQEQRTFIDWFVAVRAKITSSGPQVELKLYSLSRESGNIIFTKPIGKSLPDNVIPARTDLSGWQAGLINLPKRHKKQRKEEIMKTTLEEYGRGTFHLLKKGKSEGILCPKDKG